MGGRRPTRDNRRWLRPCRWSGVPRGCLEKSFNEQISILETISANNETSKVSVVVFSPAITQFPSSYEIKSSIVAPVYLVTGEVSHLIRFLTESGLHFEINKKTSLLSSRASGVPRIASETLTYLNNNIYKQK